MISKYTFGKPFNTNAVIKDLPVSTDFPAYLTLSKDLTSFSTDLSKDDVIYGLGESVRGINKRGYRYISNCSDDFSHTEDKSSLYAAHNFIIVDGATKYGIFVDYPSKVYFDLGYTDPDVMTVSVEEVGHDVYVIEGNSVMDIIKEFRGLIGESYIAPYWAFGYQQSRWGYNSADDIRAVVKGYRSNNIPLESVFVDIDYMDNYKDFTINEETFPKFNEFVKEMQAENIHLVPIIDAAVKLEEGYSVYEEGVANNYFCKDEDGNDFVTAVWPGLSVLPDFLNPEARDWFGMKYEVLTSMGIDGFWNDMNEPALFYSEKNLKKTMSELQKYANMKLTLSDLWSFKDMVNGLANSPEDYRSFYHNVDGEMVRHDKVHNIYGYNMTVSAADAFKKLEPDKRFLMISRASYIGMHRYSGIWTGDNSSWWAHIELLMHQLPNINMCGFLYTGADTGGFNQNTTEDHMMRFMELSLFTPLMRNHAALGTRDQELYRFKDIDSFRNIVNLRYGFIPYLYSEYLKAVKNNTLMFTPMGIAFPEDKTARHIEDQLMVGDSIMIAPVYKQNAVGRYVYLPEDMTMIRFRSLTDRDVVPMSAGHHYVDVALNEVLVFVRKDAIFFTGKAAQSTAELANNEYTFYSAEGFKGEYEMYTDVDKSTVLKN
jgi:alpha-glucosidase